MASGRDPVRAARCQKPPRALIACRKLLTKTGAPVYAARKAIVERVIGKVKHARAFRQFLLWGFEKVQRE